MKLRLLLLACAGCAGNLWSQPSDAAPAKADSLRAPVTPITASADSDYATFQELLTRRPPASPTEMGALKYYTWLDEHRRSVSAAGLGFYVAHLEDPRRWESILAVSKNEPIFAKSYGPDVGEIGPAAAVVDGAEKMAWEKRIEALKAALIAAPDAPVAVREETEWRSFGRDFSAMSAAKMRGEKFDYAAFRPRFEAHVARYASLDVVAARAADYLGALERHLPGTTVKIWRQLREAPNAALRQKAVERVKFFERMSQPLEIAFTAVDGRAVDLRNLRGKVVLIDFWATWCGPCKEEIPNVKRAYAAYHDQGFEVVGIALENSGLSLQDLPEQAAAKREKARKVLADFTMRNGMPWPQYFDGKGWENDISTRFNITSIPAMFLLDRSGVVVSTDARGPKLEQEITRLLAR